MSRDREDRLWHGFPGGAASRKNYRGRVNLPYKMMRLIAILREAGEDFAAGVPFQQAAALSYYTLLSMAPLLLVVTGVSGYLISEAVVQRELIGEMRDLVGEQGAELMHTVIANASGPERGVVSTLIGVALILVGATTVFAQLQAALNRVWHVEAVPANALTGFVRARLISFAMVLGIGFLLLVSLLASAVLVALHDYLHRLIPGFAVVWSVADLLGSFALVTILIALLFKFVPDVHIDWRSTWLGALATALFFTLGKSLIGLYLGRASVGSAYGAAGSAVVLMVWVYYASLILFFGAALTRVIARRRGVPLRPNAFARRIDT
jgi:membrane protein